ncbi:MAG: SOS response-associated peptidase [Bacteroidia bacterium]|nr:SOS response-associated peptidase [Bacteroidia bacterium]
MCGRYVLIDKLEAYEQRFNAAAGPFSVHIRLPNYNVVPGALAPVITNDKPDEIQFFRFGMTPFWAKKPMYLINARAEGDHNADDDPDYHGAKGIISKPSFRKPIRSQRCLVIADYFIEGPKKEKLDKPYLVYLKRRPFAMAGIWDQWADPNTGEILYSFSIITTTPNRILQKIHHHRSPVILHERDERQWLEAGPLASITDLLEPYDSDEMNAYPIGTRIKNPRSNDIELLEPLGDPVEQDVELRVVRELKLQGMGYTRRDERKE